MANKSKFKLKVRGRKVKMRRVEWVEYSNCVISSGLAKGLPPDPIYLRFERPGEKPTTIFLRPDEVTAVIFTLGCAMWTHQMMEIGNSRKGKDKKNG